MVEKRLRSGVSTWLPSIRTVRGHIRGYLAYGRSEDTWPTTTASRTHYYGQSHAPLGEVACTTG
eukprot:4850661-Prymnesium_polylepis.1